MHPQAGLLPAGAVRPGLVPGQSGHPAAGAGFGLSQATSYRYVAEGTRVVSAQAPGLEEALERAVAGGRRT
jgi:hypothetical protein